MFSRDYHIRYSDLATDNKISITGLLSILQDVSIVHSTQLGFPVDVLIDRGLAWLLGGWRVKLSDRAIGTGTITVDTCVCDIQRCQSQRQYIVRLGGNAVAYAKALWFMADIITKKPIRIPEDIAQSLPLSEDVTGIEFEKIRPLDVFEPEMDFKVLRKDLDTNKHMNNIKSFDYALELLPENFKYSEVEISYKKNSVYGDRLQVGGSASDGFFQSELRDNEGKPVTICRFYK